MARVALIGGYYVAANIIADAQRCLNLAPEKNPDDSPCPFTDYPRAGLRLLLTLPTGPCRGAYTSSDGQLWMVGGPTLYNISPQWIATAVGDLQALYSEIVGMTDNGLTLLLVDGSPSGYTCDLSTHAFAAINDAAFYGSPRADYLDTYFLLSRPGLPTMYCSNSLSTTFNPLFFADKETAPDPIAGLVVVAQDVYFIGTQTTEVFVDAGNPDFPFQRLPSILINHGLAAPKSLAKVGPAVFFLSQDLSGTAVVVKLASYQATRISTHAIETAIGKYPVTSDAIGMCYQKGGHNNYMLTFPSADKTWVWDDIEQLWHEEAWIDGDGAEHRHRASCMAFAHGQNVCGDWQTGAVYALDPSLDSDNGTPMKFLRSFPHMTKDGNRIFYRQFIADMAVGTGVGSLPGQPPLLSLRWSDTRGASWGNYITGSLGEIGEYLTSVQFQRLGMARDRVFELSWSGNGGPTALNGAWIDTKVAGS